MRTTIESRSKCSKSPKGKSGFLSRLWTDPETPDQDSHSAALTGLNGPDLDKAAFPSRRGVTSCSAAKQHSSCGSGVLTPWPNMCVLIYTVIDSEGRGRGLCQ